MTPPYFPSKSGSSRKIKTLQSTSGFLQLKQKKQVTSVCIFSV